MKDEVILYSDEAAAKQMTITGWVSRTGRFWGDDEHMARWEGCTHTACKECGASIKKHYTKCGSCREKSRSAKYDAMPKLAWDGETPLYSDSTDQYFMSLEDLTDYLSDEEALTIEDLQLVICAPNYARQIEEDHFTDDLPEDGDLPDELIAALESLNAVIRKLPPLSWSPGKYAAIVKIELDQAA